MPRGGAEDPLLVRGIRIKDNKDMFRAAIIIAKELRAKDSNLSLPESTKKAWQTREMLAAKEALRAKKEKEGPAKPKAKKAKGPAKKK